MYYTWEISYFLSGIVIWILLEKFKKYSESCTFILMRLKFLKCLMLLGFCSYVVIWRHPADQVNIDVVAT